MTRLGLEPGLLDQTASVSTITSLFLWNSRAVKRGQYWKLFSGKFICHKPLNVYKDGKFLPQLMGQCVHRNSHIPKPRQISLIYNPCPISPRIWNTGQNPNISNEIFSRFTLFYNFNLTSSNVCHKWPPCLLTTDLRSSYSLHFSWNSIPHLTAILSKPQSRIHWGWIETEIEARQNF